MAAFQSVTIGANAGAGSVALSTNATDKQGIITLTIAASGSSLGAALFTLNLLGWEGYEETPEVIIQFSAYNAVAAALNLYVSSDAADTATPSISVVVGCLNAPVASSVAKIAYQVAAPV